MAKRDKIKIKEEFLLKEEGKTIRVHINNDMSIYTDDPKKVAGIKKKYARFMNRVDEH